MAYPAAMALDAGRADFLLDLLSGTGRAQLSSVQHTGSLAILCPCRRRASGVQTGHVRTLDYFQGVLGMRPGAEAMMAHQLGATARCTEVGSRDP